MKKGIPVFNIAACLVILSLSAILLASCQSGAGADAYNSARPGDKESPFSIGDTCTYTHFNGSALLLRVSWINKHRVEVIFTFTPSDAAQTTEYRFPDMGDIARKKTIPVTPAKYDTVHSLLQTGDVIPCIRSEIIKGTCSPVVFTFPDIEF
jgi:hypothetical protein